jgi:RimJ/RimL family protein N-acetyltransferase
MKPNVLKELNHIVIRDIHQSDLPVFFQFQLDPEANLMAAFTAKDPIDKDAFEVKWTKMLQDKGIIIKTILYKGKVSGSILKHDWFGDQEISYWIGKEFWGRGIATQAVKLFLSDVDIRPLFARVVNDNIASIRVLERNGFVAFGQDRGFANARGEEVDEIIFKFG